MSFQRTNFALQCKPNHLLWPILRFTGDGKQNRYKLYTINGVYNTRIISYMSTKKANLFRGDRYTHTHTDRHTDIDL